MHLFSLYTVHIEFGTSEPHVYTHVYTHVDTPVYTHVYSQGALDMYYPALDGLVKGLGAEHPVVATVPNTHRCINV